MSLLRRGRVTVDVMALLEEQPPALHAFVRARSSDEGEATLAAYPGLLAGDYDAPLDMLIEAARAQRAAAAESALCERRNMLERLRRGTGADSAQSLGRIALTAAAKADEEGDIASAEAALAAWQQLTSAPSFGSMPPDVRALALNQLGLAHCRCREFGGSAQHGVAARTAFEQAVTEALAAGVPATEYRCNVLITRLMEAERSEQPPLDALLALAREIVADAGPDIRYRAEALAQLAATHRLRFLKAGALADLEDAASAAEKALQSPHDDAKRREGHHELLDDIRRLQRTVRSASAGGTTEEDVTERLRVARAASERVAPAARAGALHNLALAAYGAYAASGRLDLLDEAIVAAEASLRATPPTAESYPPRANNFGMLLRQRYQDRREAGDLWKAVSALQTAVARTIKGDIDWSGHAMNLGNALTQLHELTGLPATLDEAIELLEEAVRRSPLSAPERSMQLSALSRSLRIRYAARQSHEDLDRSVEFDAEALAITPTSHPSRTLLLGNAANGLSLTSHVRDARWQRAIDLWQEACPLGLKSGPQLTLTNALTWLTRALDRKAATDATDAVGFAQQALDRLVAAQGGRREQEEWLRTAARLPSLAAQVYVEADDPQRAVLAVEQSRASLFAKMLVSADLAGAPTIDQLREVAQRGAPLAYLVPGERAVALIVDAAGVSVLRLPALTEDAVQDAVSRLYWGYYHRHEAPDGWRRAFDEVARWLWGAAMGPLLGALGAHRHVNLLPSGLLALLPLHAAWKPDTSRPATGRRYAGDDVLIALQPNVQPLLRPVPATMAGGGHLVAVAEPRPSSERPLRWAVAEAHAALAAFGATEEPLVHENATRERVLAAMADADVVHFACHGRMNIKDPLAGGLLLAGDEILTITAVVGAHLDARLIVASSCESASVAPGLPDEVVNLAAALLHAGSQAVLASAFTVDDFCALVLATRFYAEWETSATGPEALRAAVRFLRDTTNAEKLSWVAELRRSGHPTEVTDALAGVLSFADPAEHSFVHPVDWAPFTWWGQHVGA